MGNADALRGTDDAKVTAPWPTVGGGFANALVTPHPEWGDVVCVMSVVLRTGLRTHDVTETVVRGLLTEEGFDEARYDLIPLVPNFQLGWQLVVRDEADR